MKAPITSEQKRRKTGKQRARKLRKRGISVWWDAKLQSRVWEGPNSDEPMDDATRYALGAM